MQKRFSLLAVLLCLLASPAILRADYKQAVAMFAQGRYDKALELIKPDVAANPTWEFGHRLTGLCHLQLGQNSLAVASLTKALQLKSEAFATFQGLGQAYYNLGKFSDALQILNSGERLAKGPADEYNLHHLRGAAQLRLKNYNEAVADLTGAIKINPTPPLNYYQLGAAYLGLNLYTDAIAALEKADKGQPADAATRELLGRAYELGGADSLRSKDWDSAIQRLTRARDLQPGKGPVHYNLGQAYLFQNRLKEAEEALQKANTLMPGNAGVLERLGFCYEKLQAYDKSLAAYQAAYQAQSTPENLANVERAKLRKKQS